jgi:hypothetical protein
LPGPAVLGSLPEPERICRIAGDEKGLRRRHLFSRKQRDISLCGESPARRG